MNRFPLGIGLVTVANLPHGTGRTGRLRALAGCLAGMGHQVTIWNQHGLEHSGGQQVSGSLGGARFEYVLGTTDRKWGFNAIPMKLRAVRQVANNLRRSFSQGQFQLLMFNHLAFYDTYPLTRLAKRLGVPTIQCYEDERRELVGTVRLPQRVFGLNSWMADHWCSPMADQIWVISSYLAEKYARLSRKPETVKVIPTVVDCAAWSLPPEPMQAVPVLLYTGSFSEQDDLERLLQALGCLKRQKVEFRARLLGATSKSELVGKLKLIAETLQIAAHIEFVGFQPAEVVKQEIANANILLNLRTDSLWSRSGLSTKLSEYLAAGRAVLTTNVGDNARYVENGRSAIVVEAGADPKEIAEVLKQAIENPPMRLELANGARRAALKHFDVPVVQKLIKEALAQIPRLQIAHEPDSAITPLV